MLIKKISFTGRKKKGLTRRKKKETRPDPNEKNHPQKSLELLKYCLVSKFSTFEK
jgi:hypothetical protein